MTSFIGDYSCKVDPKGRIMLPQAFKKQMSEGAGDKFVIKKDMYEKCLVLIPLEDWKKQYARLYSNLDEYDQEHKMFFREYSKGIAELELDASNRFLIPARLMKLAEIDKDVVLAGQFEQIEIWSKDLYDQIGNDPIDFQKRAKKILGSNKNNSSTP
jgi:MraZ protein